jgi:tRNA(Ile)-lysidine synthase
MKEKVKEIIKKYNLINTGDKIVLGVSGGPDSIAMLDILRQLKSEMEFEIYVVHINHSIRGEDADEDEEYVKNYCRKYEIECFTKKIDVPTIARTEKIGTEEAGRKVRYEYFEEILKETGSNKIAIAHNKNDNVETIIMHLLRGSGISGLKGIEPIRENKFIKPLIECDRQEIEKYCEENNLQPRIDKTNFENECTRNKIRNIVIPYIKKEFNPNIIETMTRLSDVISSENDFIENIAKENYNKILVIEGKDKIELKLKEFNLLDEVLKNRIILIATKKLFGSTQGIEKVNIVDIIKLCNNNIGNKFLMPNKNLKVLIQNKKINFIKIN